MQWLYDNPIYNLELLRARRRSERNKWLLYLDPACYWQGMWAVVGVYIIMSLLCCSFWTPVLLTFSIAVACAYAGALERLNGCLDMLLMTPVTPAQVIWGKALSRFIPALRVSLLLLMFSVACQGIVPSMGVSINVIIATRSISTVLLIPMTYIASIGVMLHGSILGTSLGLLMGNKRNNAHATAAFTAVLALCSWSISIWVILILPTFSLSNAPFIFLIALLWLIGLPVALFHITCATMRAGKLTSNIQ